MRLAPVGLLVLLASAPANWPQWRGPSGLGVSADTGLPTPEILARNDLGERLVASPAIAGGRIFLRSDARLFAIGSGTVTPPPVRQ